MPESDDEHGYEYPAHHVPVTLIDGVYSMSWREGLVKAYLVRYLPEIHAKGPVKDVIVEQLVIPKMGFLLTANFFHKQLQLMIDAGFITQKDIETAKSYTEESQGGQ